MAAEEDFHHEEQTNRFEAFLLQYQKPLIYILGSVLVIVIAYLAWDQLYLKQQDKQARQVIFHAQEHFENDSLDKALNGDGQHPGFEDIIDQYGWTETANLAHYYSGIIYLKKGNYQKAIDRLSAFDTESKMLQPLAYGGLGDAYTELEKYGKAVSYYMDAAKTHANPYTAPIYLMKAGMIAEENGNLSKALSAYKKIKKDFPDSDQASEIEKYIARVESKMSTS